jgi:hypothetical protein
MTIDKKQITNPSEPDEYPRMLFYDTEFELIFFITKSESWQFSLNLEVNA